MESINVNQALSRNGIVRLGETPDVEIEKVAEILYSNYNTAVGGVAWNGDKLPDWAEFSQDENKQKQVYGWRVAALAALGI
jgi:hypothetical protein